MKHLFKQIFDETKIYATSEDLRVVSYIALHISTRHISPYLAHLNALGGIYYGHKIVIYAWQW